jgi:hypothetical protein
MGVISTQNLTYRIVANGQQLDVFQDEDLQISNNITALFDLGTLPSSFTKNITIPGSKINNAFFEHMYDISIYNPYLFATNVKVPCYLDFNSIYLVNGYLQLNKVNVYENKAIDSYEITIYGTLSSLARDTSNAFITNLTSLAKYNHTSSVQNILDSWNGNLFNGDIVYPMCDYGNDWQYTPGADFTGIDSNDGAMTVQNFKPAIRMVKVFDAIMEYAGYTYTSEFLSQAWVQDVYLLANNQLKYPIYSDVDLETYGQMQIGPISGSGMTNILLNEGSVYNLPWFNILSDPQGFVGNNSSYRVDRATKLQLTINLNVTVSSSVNNVPAFYLYMIETGSYATGSYATLPDINNYYNQVYLNRNGGINLTTQVQQEATITINTPGTYYFAIQWLKQYSTTAPTIVFDKDNVPKSFLRINEVKQAADGRIMDIPSNMPFATTGIKMIDFLVGIQQKFHLVMYPDKSKVNHFIIETFNDWYKKGRVKSFDNYIDLNKSISVIPANNLAVNKLQFGDSVDTDYISQQFSKEANRDFGKAYYVDTTNFFSQGEYKVETTFASAPLTYINGTGLSGSVGGYNPPANSTQWALGGQGYNYQSSYAACNGVYYYPQTVYSAESNAFDITQFYTDPYLTTPFNGTGYFYKFYKVSAGATYYSTDIAYGGYTGATIYQC